MGIGVFTMKIAALRSYKTGVLVPVYSLRTELSFGSGEFLDLIPFADWCNKSGIDLVQLLPVNDTGDDASPYNALSAFALQPIFCRVQAIPEFKDLDKNQREKIEHVLAGQNNLDASMEYAKVRMVKIEALKILYAFALQNISKDKNFVPWIEKNSWAKDYGVFMALKDSHNRSSWQSWKDEFRRGSAELVDKLWKNKEYGAAAKFWVWLQYRLEQQFLEVASYYENKSIILKGDIPIMMNEDSVDVWSQCENFNLEMRAGAPPDMFSQSGQNWGFPTYNWEYLEAHDYAWWRNRLRQADKFYHAFRIDHVLGFFRIWSIQREHSSGLLGSFNPSIQISENDLFKLGFDNGRIKWLAEPHIPGQRLQDTFGMRCFEIIGRCFERLGNEELYLFKSEIDGERYFDGLPLMDDEKGLLLGMYQDRALISLGGGMYSPTWKFRDCWRYQIMGEREKSEFENLVHRCHQASELIWQKQGERLLGFMKHTVPMLACAEDLGVVPDCVPVSLKKLGVLSLKIPRWAKRYAFPGEPYIAPANYPWLSVCAASVHDTSTLRQWWEEEADREQFWQVIGGHGNAQAEYTAEFAKEMIRCLLLANSAIVIFQLQDYFALKNDYRAKIAAEERMNVPGTVAQTNWSWRMKMTIENLIKDNDFNAIIKDLLAERKKRQVTKDE
jgi:4-alpha-glucanotransferase